MMIRKFFYIFTIFISTWSFSQDQQSEILKNKENYELAFLELAGMLNGSTSLSFKRAVFITENAFLDNRLEYAQFNQHINKLVRRCEDLIKTGGLSYNDTDRKQVEKYWSVFMVMKKLNTFEMDSSTSYYPITPFTYDFDDFWGETDWTKMFVTKLLSTTTGNCHSLPFLYKILCEELGTTAHLAMAPNHIYIKHWTKKTGWFNTELTSGYFPIDAWIMASGYVHLSAVQNRVYMDTLSAKQSISICLIDLAKGYERKFGQLADLNFIMKCSDLALLYYPQYVNGLILKAEIMKSQFAELMNKHSAKYPSDIFIVPEAKALFDEMEELYFHIHNIGYRMMPKEMYLNWLDELRNERQRYLNKDIGIEFNASK